MKDITTLKDTLARIDGRGYKSYKAVAGDYDGERFSLHIDHVQGDPFAAPSKVRIRVGQRIAQWPPELFTSRVRRIALEDFIARQVRVAIARIVQGRRGSGKSGQISVDAGGQEVLERTATVITNDWVEVRLHVGLPAQGRRVSGVQAAAMLCVELPQIADRALHWKNQADEEVRAFVECVENQEHIRRELPSRKLAAFVANGSVLPRESGATDRPLPFDAAVPFVAPEPLTVTFDLPNPISTEEGSQQRVTGLGVPRGITLIVGGGYHGKSTLLAAIERGVYAHIPGDGREYVVTDPNAVKIRAEDGRRVERVNISPFINNLPHDRSTEAFQSDDASGSTSQAADIIEAIEVGATTLLLDEDTSATNFMVRDARMQQLVQKEHEPITPLLDRIRELYDAHGVATIMVMGGCGDYFDVADTVLIMRDYVPQDGTQQARDVASTLATQRRPETTSRMSRPTPRIPLADSFDASRGRRDVKIDAKSLDRILYGTEPIDLRSLEQLVDVSQTRAVGYAIHLATNRFMNGRSTLTEVLDELESFFDRAGLDGLDPFQRGEHHPGDFARPRRYEIAAAINRLRTVRMSVTTEPQASTRADVQ